MAVVVAVAVAVVDAGVSGTFVVVVGANVGITGVPINCSASCCACATEEGACGAFGVGIAIIVGAGVTWPNTAAVAAPGVGIAMPAGASGVVLDVEITATSPAGSLPAPPIWALAPA